MEPVEDRFEMARDVKGMQGTELLTLDFQIDSSEVEGSYVYRRPFTISWCRESHNEPVGVL